ncbi:MAG TPA: hypothetical protein VGI96_48680 [Streptosporangiaceae bacterium]|jgi:hypothetical protein
MTLLVDWLTVASLLLLTLGTGAQALANLTEFRGLTGKTTESFSTVVKAVKGWRASWWHKAAVFVTNITAAPLYVLGKSQTDGENDATRLLRFLRQATAWTILMIGSALGLAAAVIVLVAAYR